MEEPHKTHKEPAWGWIGALALVAGGQPQDACYADHATRCRAQVKKPKASVAKAGPYAP